MLRIALKSLLGHKLRMVLTAISIILGVGFVAGSYIFTDTISSSFDDIFDDVFGSVDIIVKPAETSFEAPGSGGAFSQTTIPENILEDVRAIDGVDRAEGEVSGLAQIIKEDGNIANTTGAPSFGFSWVDVPEFNPLVIQPGGRAPQDAGEVVIDVSTAETNGYEVGETVRIIAAGPVEEFEIVGLIKFGEADTLAGATIAAFEFEEAQRIFGIDEGFSQISVTSGGGVEAEELKRRIDAVLPSGAESLTGEQEKSDSLDQINEGIGFLNTALLSFAMVAVFVGGFIIFNTFQIIVSQRSKELALLRAVGATRKQVRRVVVYEAFFVGVFASCIGILVGIGVSNLLRSAVNQIGAGLPTGPLSVEPRTIIASFMVGIVVTVLSALIPAIKASRVSPVEAMHASESAAPSRSLKKRSAFGLAVTALGAGLLLLGLFSSLDQPVVLVGTGAGIMFIGIAIFSPALSQPIANIVGIFVVGYYRLVGQIAKRNAQRTPRRTSFTASALMIGVSLVVFASIFASSIKATIDDVIVENFPGDISISSKLLQTNPFGATFSSEIAQEVEQLDEIELVATTKYDIAKIQGSEELIIAIEPDKFNKAFALNPSGGSYSQLGEDAVYVLESKLEDLGLEVGDTIDVEYALTGASTLTITGSFSETFDSPYLISDETYFANFTNRDDLFAVANVSDGVSIEDGKAAINSIVDKYPTVQIQDKDELINDARTQIDQALGFLTALLGLAMLIAIFGITNTLTLSVTERTREIGMLRAIGMTRPQIRKMIRAESIIIAVFGALLGMAMGIFFGWAILRALEDIGFTAFSIPAVQLGVYLVVAVLAGVVAAIVPSYKASRMNILDAINYE